MGLEQFGTGLDSFQLLTHFKPAFLKLDRNLTQDINSNHDSLEKIREITSRAQDKRNCNLRRIRDRLNVDERIIQGRRGLRARRLRRANQRNNEQRVLIRLSVTTSTKLEKIHKNSPLFSFRTIVDSNY